MLSCAKEVWNSEFKVNRPLFREKQHLNPNFTGVNVLCLNRYLKTGKMEVSVKQNCKMPKVTAHTLAWLFEFGFVEEMRMITLSVSMKY